MAKNEAIELEAYNISLVELYNGMNTGKTSGSFLQGLWSSNFVLQYLSTRDENLCSQKDLFMSYY
jgi:hypothetical protein